MNRLPPEAPSEPQPRSEDEVWAMAKKMMQSSDNTEGADGIARLSSATAATMALLWCLGLAKGSELLMPLQQHKRN